MSGHPLDRSVWRSLTTRRAPFATGNDRARRLRPDVGLFVAAAAPDRRSLTAMAALVGEAEQVGMIEPDRWPVPPGLAVVSESALVQMTAPTIDPAPPTVEVLPLDRQDASAMLALATLTRPGPFFADTPALGGFVGVKQDGELIAMAGTRLSLPGYVEISGVCTRRDRRGRGLAAALIRHVAAAILADGDVPFLTSYADNRGAIALYESIGFATRREMVFTVLERG